MQPIDVVFLCLIGFLFVSVVCWLAYIAGKDAGTQAEQARWLKAAKKGRPRRIERLHIIPHEYSVVYLGEKEEATSSPDATPPQKTES